MPWLITAATTEVSTFSFLKLVIVVLGWAQCPCRCPPDFDSKLSEKSKKRFLGRFSSCTDVRESCAVTGNVTAKSFDR